MKHCPSCRNQVPPEAEDCPYCPASFRIPVVRQRGHGLGWSWRHPLPWLVIGLALWVAGAGAHWLLEEAVRQYPMQRAPAPLSVPAAVISARPETRIVAPPPAAEEMVTVVAPPSRPTPTEWRLEGTVYDLVSLAPIVGCALVFGDPSTGRRFETSTDERGRYRSLLPPLERGGYSATLRHPDFASTYLNPGVEGVRQMGIERRQALAAELARSITAAYTVQPFADRRLVTDFYLAPR